MKSMRSLMVRQADDTVTAAWCHALEVRALVNWLGVNCYLPAGVRNALA